MQHAKRKLIETLLFHHYLDLEVHSDKLSKPLASKKTRAVAKAQSTAYTVCGGRGPPWPGRHRCIPPADPAAYDMALLQQWAGKCDNKLCEQHHWIHWCSIFLALVDTSRPDPPNVRVGLPHSPVNAEIVSSSFTVWLAFGKSIRSTNVTGR